MKVAVWKTPFEQIKQSITKAAGGSSATQGWHGHKKAANPSCSTEAESSSKLRRASLDSKRNVCFVCERESQPSEFYSAGPFVISLFLFVKIDLATDSGSKYDRDKKKIGFHFFLHV